ncbi:hypothetical protein PTSG_09080 [Salpingoeca rosetta]|uniref:Major facilitator superfamily (MFS) profile domain-containing protein n=1 Tax=Salpingoeca rosetta (strain ATCC 50818 / BSB-021) TaxID=946362 RepID=F2UM53_SALR5|nr:uncharacterized protein PTSG_09080 [Salpingoeca rosetta]EGD78202.1 hypothetical protein PTSG_09080 [Salpingoeca rosetta]|eukprot:XP_004989878.1 hypothetical protein PTSG_09080 [Salpingoeca rosetta]
MEIGWGQKALFWAVMFLYMMAIQLGGAPGNELVQKMVCERDRHHNVVNATQPDYCDSSRVTGKASELLVYYNLAMVIPSFFVVTTLGALSDKFGRKPMMFLPCVGSLLQQLGILLVIYMDLALPWLYLPMLCYGIFGTYALFLMSLFTSVADVTSEKDRTAWIGVMEGMNLAGACAGYYIGGVVTRQLGYAAVFWLVACVYVLVMVLICFIREPLLKQNRKRHVPWADANIVAVLLILFRRLDRALLGTAFLLLMTTQVGYQIVILYLRHIFHWHEDTVGAFLAVFKATQGLSVLVVLRVITYFFGQKAKDYPLAQVSLAVMIAQYLLWAFFREEHVMFALTALGLIAGMASAIARSMISKTASPSEQGGVFSALGAVEVLTGLTGPMIFNHVYTATVHTRDNTFLFVGAGLSGVVALLLWWYAAVRPRKEPATELDPLITNFTGDPNEKHRNKNVV